MTLNVDARHMASAAMLALAMTFLCSCDEGGEAPPAEPPASPNILFVVLDDFGVDQLEQYGYGGATPAATPTLDALAEAGVRFRNAWSMPTCTPTRATFF